MLRGDQGEKRVRFLLRTDCAEDGVPFLEQRADDPAANVSVGAGDENRGRW